MGVGQICGIRIDLTCYSVAARVLQPALCVFFCDTVGWLCASRVLCDMVWRYLCGGTELRGPL
eukprot:1287061-Rhodomonas_salina.2